MCERQNGDLFVQFGAEHLIGFGSDRRELGPTVSREAQGLRTLEMLSRSLNMETCLAFVGAGCSAPFGLPGWKRLAKDLASRALVGENSDLAIHHRHRLRGFIEKDSPSSMEVISILGLSQRSIESSLYRDILKEIFSPPEATSWQGSTDWNPYQALHDLGFHRFISSNYDPLLELTILSNRDPRARSRSGSPNPDELLDTWRSQELSKILEGKHSLRSFHQDCEPSSELIELMLSRDSRGRDESFLIFHCHGRIDEPSTMVVTEEDYKRWYMRQSGRTATFQQTIQLLLTASPVCFFGFSMTDEDLLAVLRRFIGRAPGPSGTRPVFALIGAKEEDEGWERADYLLDRFGLHVILYKDDESAPPKERGKYLCRSIRSVKKSWDTWRASWLKKPKICPVSAPRKRAGVPTYIHYAPSIPAIDLAKGRTDLVLGGIEKNVRLTSKNKKAARHPFLFLGSGGTGKSVLARRFLERASKKRKLGLKKLFFWSSYYSDDSLTGIDRALIFFEGPRPLARESRLDRLREVLKRRENLLIFDGIERFLKVTDNPGEGVSVNWQTREFLEILSSEECRAVVILTSRLRPRELSSILVREKNEFLLTTIRVDDLPVLNSGEFNDLLAHLGREEKSILCALLGGHTYALRLALKSLAIKGPDYSEALVELRQQLSHTPPESRITQMIGIAIDRVCCGSHPSPRARKSAGRLLLERLAVFMSPVREPVLHVCQKGLFSMEPGESGNLYGELIESLKEAELLLQIESTEPGSERQIYTLHPTVREFVFRRFHRASVDSLPSLILPGFTSGGSAVYPGSDGAEKVVLSLLNTLIEETEKNKDMGNLEEARELCRSAFGLVRSRMSAMTVTRWSDYDEYLLNIIQVANVAKLTAMQHWSFADRQDFDTVVDHGSSLYAEELAWLYNELGLVLYIQGSMLESLAVWQQQFEISLVIDSFEEGGPFLIQAHLNLGAAYIEFGRIAKAEEHLQRALRASLALNDDDHIGRIRGYLALVEHLRGDFRRARDGYSRACAVVKKGRNVRAECVFRRHLGDAFIRLGEPIKAKVELVSSLALAERGSYRELEGYTRVSLARYHAVEDQWKEAIEECNAAMRIACDYRIGKLEVDVLSEQSRLNLTLGDASTATLKALEALRLATELSLELRQTRALVLLGHANVKSGITELGVECLKFAKRRARQQQYFVQAHEAEKLLANFTEHESRDAGRAL